MCHRILLLLSPLLLAPGCNSGDDAGSNPIGFTQRAIDVALSRYYEDPNHAEVLIYRTVFTPGTTRYVGGTPIPIIGRDDIPKGKEVNLVRIGLINASTVYTVPEEPVITVELVVWPEIGESQLRPMHACSKYEMKINQDGELTIVKESLVLE